MESSTLSLGDEQLVGLELAGELYGVEIGRIQEIIRMQPITAVPNGPAHIAGVTNLRGRVIPVMDLRRRFGLPVGEETHRWRIVVAEDGAHAVGLIVDGVSEVLRVSREAVESPSSLVVSDGSAYLRGVAKLGGRLVLLLDLSPLLISDELDALVA